MPASNTITSFYSFTANTKARANQVSNNFDVFRGHLLPVDPTLTAASNLAYDLGSVEHRWRKSYLGDVNLGPTTTSWRLYDNTTTGLNGNLVFARNGVSVMEFDANGPISRTIPQWALKARAVTYDGTDPGAYGIGFSLGYPSVEFGSTVSALNFNCAATVTVSAITSSTCSVTSVGGPIEVSLYQKSPTAMTATGIVIQAAPNTTTALNAQIYAQIIVYRNTTTAEVARLNYALAGAFSTATGQLPSMFAQYPWPGTFLLDTSAPAGLNTYFAYLAYSAYPTVTSGQSSVLMTNFRFCAKELF